MSIVKHKHKPGHHCNRLMDWRQKADRNGKLWAHTKFAEVFYFWLENIFIEFFAVLYRKQDRIKFTDSTQVVWRQGCQ